MSTSGAAALPPAALGGFENIPRYWDAQQGVWIAQVVAGSYYVTTGAEIFTTVLGSCVSTCIRDPIAKVGGMNHFMLPEDPSQDPGGSVMRYGSFAIERLVNDLVKHGARRERLEIKVFGGGRVIASQSRIGELNVDFVRRYLRDEGLSIAVEDVGGPWARRLRYSGLSGRAQVKHLEIAETRKVAADERALRSRLRHQPERPAEVDLF